MLQQVRTDATPYGISDLPCPASRRAQRTGPRHSRSTENSCRASPLIGRPNLVRLGFVWISTIALSCSLRPPDIYYVTDHYVPYNVVLVRLSRVNSDVLRDLLGMAHKFVTRNAAPRLPARKRRKPGPRKA